MNFLQSFRIALDMLRQHKLRAFLTMFGVIIGVMSVSLISLVSGAFQTYLDNQFKKLGSDTIFVFYDPERRGHKETIGPLDKLTIEDRTYITERVPNLGKASACKQLQGVTAKFGSQDYSNPVVWAVDENYQELNRFGIEGGRSVTKADIDLKSNIAVIGTDVETRLFGKGKGLGKLVTMNGIAMKVAGVLENSEFFGESTSRMILVPLTTAQSKWVGGRDVTMLLFQAPRNIEVGVAMDSIWRVLMQRSNNKAIYRVDSRESILNVFKGVIGAAGVILAAIAALSLLVGGIGIMNIMLVSVTERTREIGLRKAVGAKRNAILTQFLIEATTLSMVGGLIGMFAAYCVGLLVTAVTIAAKWPNADGLAAPFPLSAAIQALLFSAFIGVTFGLYPAFSAAKLDPIVALRHE